MKSIFKKAFFVVIALCILVLCSCENDSNSDGTDDTSCKHTDISVQDISPACDTEGYKLNTCNGCGISYKTDIVPPKGHTYTVKETKPTCRDYGYSTYTCECGFSYISDYVNKLGHYFTGEKVEPTCDKYGYTTYTCECGFSYMSDYVKELGHSLKDEIVSPTCTDGGHTTYKCTRCEFSYISSYVPAKGHSLVSDTIAPTCTEQGYTEYKCTECQYSYNSDILPPTGHTIEQTELSAATCTETGETQYSCACGYKYTVSTPATGHDFTQNVTMPTLSDMGYTLFACQRCDYEYKGNYTFYSDILPNGAYADGDEVIAHGIDISYYQYSVDDSGQYIPLDFEAIKAAGIDYVIIRIGDPRIGIDPTFEMSYNGAREAGLDVGAYFFSRATNVHDSELEAKFVLSVIQGKKFEYPIYLDLEDNDENTASCPRPEDYTEMCVRFFSLLQANGYYTGLYVNNVWLAEKLQTDTVLGKFDVWYARYPSEISGEPTWDTEKYGEQLGMWQYSDSGSIDGIESNVDILLCYKNYPEIIKGYGLNGYNEDFTSESHESPYVWIKVSGQLNVRSKCDYYITDDYDSKLDVVGFAKNGERFEVLEITDKYLKILYDGQQAYISSLDKYVSLCGMY